jgi:hypothetical protein
MTVDSQAMVNNLNAQFLDGKQASEFATGTGGKADAAAHADTATSADALDGKDSRRTSPPPRARPARTPTPSTASCPCPPPAATGTPPTSPA